MIGILSVLAGIALYFIICIIIAFHCKQGAKDGR